MSWPVMVFDIESIPDLQGMRALGLIEGDDDDQAYGDWVARRAAEGKSDFAPLHLQRVLVISCVFRNAEGLRIHSFVDREPEVRRGASCRLFTAPSKSTPLNW